MFNIWIINYSSVIPPFGGNTSLSSKITNYRKMDSDWTFPDSVPTTWVDWTIFWASFFTPAKINWGYSFTTNDYVELDDSSFDTPWDFSTWGWINLDTLWSSTDTRFMSKRDSWADGWMMLVNTNGKFRIDFYANSGTYYTNSAPTATLTTWTWYHVWFSYNNTSKLLQCYINGSADWSVTTAWNPTLNNIPLRIWKALTNFFEWDWDEFFFAKNSVLSAQDWSDLYNWWPGLSY